jgi:hypothetical protein
MFGLRNGITWMKESNFVGEFRSSVPIISKQINSFISYTKIPDAFQRGAETRFTSVKFFDVFLVEKGLLIALEFKMCKKLSIAFDSIREVQELKLQELINAGAKSFIVINFRFEYSATEAKKRQEKSCNKSFAIPIMDWMKAKETHDKKSLKLEWMEENAIFLPKIKLEKSKIGWDFSKLLC